MGRDADRDDGTAAPEKARLRMLLQEAAVLEQQFMCQYLYAAFSLKKGPDGSCSDAEFEHVRRWASTLYKVARQEMEHLSVVNSILTATGLEPCFWRFGFPTQSAWLTGEARAAGSETTTQVPCDLPFVLSRFDLTTVTRFMCMESPQLSYVPPDYQPLIASQCYVDATGKCPCAPPGEVEEVPRFEHTTVDLESVTGVGPGSVQLLYEAIEAELDDLAANYGETWLFSGHESGQSEIPSEYNIYLFPICDLRSAKAGIRLVKEQGEGIEAPAGYNAHFELFAEIVRDYQTLLAANPGFVPSIDLPLNPSSGGYSNPTAVQAAQTFDHGYYLLLQMLTSYYAYYRKGSWGEKPHLAESMEQAAFAPMMTMFVRSFAEVMAMIPSGTPGQMTGGSFFLAVSQIRTLQAPQLGIYTDINHFIDGVAGLVAAVEALSRRDVPPEAVPKLEFIYQTMTRVALKLGYVYQDGIFAKFDPSNPDNICKHEDRCD